MASKRKLRKRIKALKLENKELRNKEFVFRWMPSGTPHVGPHFVPRYRIIHQDAPSETQAEREARWNGKVVCQGTAS